MCSQVSVAVLIDIYYGLSDGNQDLFSSRRDGKNNGPRPDLYVGFGGNPDLNF